MTLYTLVRNTGTEESNVRRISSGVSYIECREEGPMKGRFYQNYPSLEAATLYAERLWNRVLPSLNLVPSEVTRVGEIKFRMKKFGRDVVLELKDTRIKVRHLLARYFG